MVFFKFYSVYFFKAVIVIHTPYPRHYTMHLDLGVGIIFENFQPFIFSAKIYSALWLFDSLREYFRIQFFCQIILGSLRNQYFDLLPMYYL